MRTRSFSTSPSRWLNASSDSRTGFISSSVARSRCSALASADLPWRSSVSLESTLNWAIIDSRSVASSFARPRAASRCATAAASWADTSAASLMACAALARASATSARNRSASVALRASSSGQRRHRPARRMPRHARRRPRAWPRTPRTACLQRLPAAVLARPSHSLASPGARPAHRGGHPALPRSESTPPRPCLILPGGTPTKPVTDSVAGPFACRSNGATAMLPSVRRAEAPSPTAVAWRTQPSSTDKEKQS